MVRFADAQCKMREASGNLLPRKEGQSHRQIGHPPINRWYRYIKTDFSPRSKGKTSGVHSMAYREPISTLHLAASVQGESLSWRECAAATANGHTEWPEQGVSPTRGKW